MIHPKDSLAALALVTAALLGPAACTANIHDNTADIHDNTINVDNAKVSFSVDEDVDNVKVEDSISVKANVEDVILMEPSAKPASDQVKGAGHLRFYLDDYNSTAILVTGKANATLKLPTGTNEGKHKILCRVHKHDGTPTKATFEITITIVITIHGGGGDAGVDGSAN